MDLVGLLKSQFLCHLVFCYVFIASGLIINTIQLFSLVLWPINKQLFRRLNCRLSYCISSRKELTRPSPTAPSPGAAGGHSGGRQVRGACAGPFAAFFFLSLFLFVWFGLEASILSSLLKSGVLSE